MVNLRVMSINSLYCICCRLLKIYNWLHTVQNNISTKLIENWDRSVYKKESMNWATILPDDLTSRTVHAGVTSDLHLRIIKMNITRINLIVSLTFLWYLPVLLK